jgi:uncharacterized coiled-coil protein SlyX
MHGYGNRTWTGSGCVCRVLLLLLAISACCAPRLAGQAAAGASVPEQIQSLTDGIAHMQSLLDQSQRQLDLMRSQLAALQSQVAQGQAAPPAAPSEGTPAPAASVAQSTPSASTSAAAAPSPESSSASAADLPERQALDASQIATLDQEKVESESKYPVRLTGLVLFNGFANTGAVDQAATPSVAIYGSGSTGASVRQTQLGFDARGPHLLGARTFGDLRVDFDGSSQAGAGPSYYTANAVLVRLRTAHAALLWNRTEAYFALDRPILSPDAPSSLTAVAEPPLAWSGNLWTWNPQVGLRQDLPLGGAANLRLEAAAIDVGDAPLTAAEYAAAAVVSGPASSAEQSRWPGAEGRIALVGSESDEQGNHLGVGGYFAPHLTSFGHGFDSWAGTLDAGLHLPGRLRASANAYRGLGLGGLGGGAYKDFLYHLSAPTGQIYMRALDDAGGWAQLQERVNERIELNGAFGIDNAFAGEVTRYAVGGNGFYQNLARNRTWTGNVIFSPSAYLLFSIEYRRIATSSIGTATNQSDVIGVAAGYRF